jgi:hypothetical protein
VEVLYQLLVYQTKELVVVVVVVLVFMIRNHRTEDRQCKLRPLLVLFQRTDKLRLYFETKRSYCSSLLTKGSPLGHWRVTDSQSRLAVRLKKCRQLITLPYIPSSLLFYFMLTVSEISFNSFKRKIMASCEFLSSTIINKLMMKMSKSTSYHTLYFFVHVLTTTRKSDHKTSCWMNDGVLVGSQQLLFCWLDLFIPFLPILGPPSSSLVGKKRWILTNLSQY